MRILVGVDDSPYSDAAIEFVRRMTWPAGTRVLIASSVQPPVAAYSEVYVPSAPQAEGLIETQLRHHQELVSRAEARLRESGLNTDARVVQGDPRESLIEVVKKEDIDLLVVGSHGRTGLAKLVMGSVASYVTSHAPCSVLVVKRGSRAA